MNKTITQYGHMAQMLQKQCYAHDWEPVGWQFDLDTYRDLLKMSHDIRHNGSGKTEWLGLPIELVHLRPLDTEAPVMEVKITDAVMIVREPVCFAMICKSPKTCRLYYLDDPQNDPTIFTDGPNTLTMKVT